MDAAALSLNIDSSKVVQAANDLDRFATASDRAAASASKVNFGNQAGSIAKLVASVQSIDSKMSALINTLSKVQQAEKALAAANDNSAASMAKVGAAVALADSHVIAYTQHLAGLAAAQRDANAHVLAFQNHAMAGGAALSQADAHVLAYRSHLASIPAAAGQAAAGVDRLTRTVASGAGAIQANTGNIAAQFQDIGVTAAMGMNPLIIGLQQGTQMSAVFAQSGGSMRDVLVGAFKQIASAQALATIGFVALIAIVIQLGIAWFNSGNEAEQLAKRIESIKVASDGVSSAQSALGNVFDLTTGKMKNQTAAAINLAKAQLLLQKATAQNNISKASSDLSASSNLGIGGRLGAYLSGDRALIEGSARVEMLTKALKGGQIGVAEAMQGFQMLADRGQITNEMFLKGSVAAANYGMEIENVKTATQGLADLESGNLSSMFINPSAAKKTPKGPKSDTEKLADIFASVTGDIAIEKARGLAEASNLGAAEAARLEKQTALLNAVQQKGIPITDGVRQKIGELAEEYAKVKIAADVSTVIRSSTLDIEKQRAAVADQAKLVGLYGDALARATREMEAQKRLRDALPNGEIVVAPNLTSGLSDEIEAVDRAARMDKMRKSAEDAAYAMDLERKGLTLTGAAALSYAFVTDRLNEARRAGIALSQAEIAAIEQTGQAYGSSRHAIDKQIESMANAREATKSFLLDLVNGVREGGNAFKSLADSAINSLNRIIDKLLDKTLNSFLDSMFSGGGAGGLFGSFMSSLGLGGNSATGAISTKAVPNALGGAYGTAQRFANGGAFTNTIVNTPTLFRFANGAALGEMGEAGPEAIMPLKRGPNGALGVQASGGGASIRMGDVHNTYSLAGAIGPEGLMAAVKQGGEATYNQLKRDLQSLLQQLDMDGTLA